MKARHIRKLREKVKAMRLYHVTETNGLFGGDFPGLDKGHGVKANSPQNAVYRYQRWYFRKHKQPCTSHSVYIAKTTRRFGKFRVVDDKGDHRYYC